MKKLWFYNVFVSLRIFFLVFAIFSCEKIEMKSIAKVDNDYIPLSLYKTEYQSFLSKIYQKDNLVNRYVYLNNLIDEKLILKYAAENQLDKDSLFLDIKKNIYDQLLLNFYFDKNINKDFILTDSELRKFFSWQNTSIHVRHLFARTNENIQRLRDRAFYSDETWESLAMECFQDSALNSNGGDLGWHNYNDLDPLFAFEAFQLAPGEISEPVRTKDGYSIIHVIEKENEGFLTEQDFQLKRKEIGELVSNFKQKRLLLDFTDNTIRDLDIHFDNETLLDLNNFLTLVNQKDLELIQEKNIVSYKNGNLKVSEILTKLSKLSNQQLAKIHTPFDLKQSILGIICRDEFLSNAQKQKIHEEKNFQENFSEEEDKSMIKYVLDRLKNNHLTNSGETIGSEKEKYFQFRDVLFFNSSVTIDSAMVKNFIM